MIQVWLLDENNFFTGESIFVEELKENMTTVPYTVGYVKGKLVDGKWIEGATEEEVENWHSQQKAILIESTQQQSLEEKVEQLQKEIDNLKIMINEVISNE